MTERIAKRYALTPQGAKDFIRSVLLTVVVNIAKLLPMFALSFALTGIIRALNGQGSVTDRMLPFLLAGVLALTFLYIVFRLQYRALYIATYSESGKRRVQLAEVLRHLPLAFFGERDLADLTTTIMADCTFLEHAFSHFYPQMIGTYISTALIGIAMLIFNWKMALAVLWVLPVAIIMVYASRMIQKRFMAKNIEARRAATDAMQELLETVPEIKACNRKEAFLKDLDQKLDTAEIVNIRGELVTGSVVTFAQTFLKVGLATTVLVGVSLLGKAEIDMTVFLLFLISATRFYDPLGGLLANIAAVFGTELRIERMRKIEEEEQMTGDTAFSPNGYDIAFDHVSFAYRDEKETDVVLRDVSFVAKQGEVTALVGPSGGGKSTATKLAARFWDPVSGTVRLGGVDIKTIDPETLLSDYAVVFQDVVLFDDSVLENIRIGKRDASDEEVIAAGRAAQCESFVSKLPDGWHTKIGENGARLSGGERQRISIARAILKDAKVVLLDEATASLDVENETAVQQALSGLVRDKTVLVIAHRMRTVMNADRIVVLKEGEVKEIGTPEELMAQDGVFARMVKLQTESMHWQMA